MTHALIDQSARPRVDRRPLLLDAAGIALLVSAAAALCRIVIALLRPPASQGLTSQLVTEYSAIALVTVLLYWGISRRASIARWGAVMAGGLMAAALVAGRAEFHAFWANLPMPVLDALLFPARLLIILGFVVAGLCCTVAPLDAFRWR